ncbi:hypothetical protein B0T11DRAFT_286730 [Plectosphaerella cucumerina]|uniref:Uncharacterized protein n=1 Tax=Plectosphaerella cucumerina TaxID=40658 RepID=A0A8K0TDH3_9PEZI|nr:hypothetical protein B0T11DRAFT_286730 [Plectosphaerella cucumerina]
MVNHKTAAPAELRAIFYWPMIISRHFVSLAEAGNPIALITLAHYCVLLSWAAEKSWCFEHWATAVLKAIAEQMRHSLWAAWLAWPLGIINGRVQEGGIAATVVSPLTENHQMEV